MVENMNRKMNIFGIDIAMFTAKETMKRVIEYVEDEKLNIVEIVTLPMLMQKKDDEEWKEQVQKFDLLIPGEKALLEMADGYERKQIKDVENRTFLRIFFKYFQKNKKTIFLLAQDNGTIEQMKKTLQMYTQGLNIVGQAALSAGSGLEETVVNEINGIEPDCVLSGLPVSQAETFIAENRDLLNARMWLGGAILSSTDMEKKKIGKIRQFIAKKVFCYHMEKQMTDNN